MGGEGSKKLRDRKVFHIILYCVLPGQNKMSKTENENRFERC